MARLHVIETSHERGLVIRPLFGGARASISYGEILTAERSTRRRRLILHTTGMLAVQVWCGRSRAELEDHLRQRGVRVVDSWGAIISPTLADFEEELHREPGSVRQSSDNA